MNTTPAIVTQAGAARLPRLALLSLCVVYVLAGFVGRSGWKFADMGALGYMAAIFGAIPFLDAVVVRYVDDRMRSRVAGIRIAISFGVSGIAVFLLGPIVKATGFETLLISMTLIACFTAFTLTWLPSERRIASAILRNQNQ